MSENTYPHIQLKNVAGYIPVNISFKFQDSNITMGMKIPKSLYEGAKTSDKIAYVVEGTPESEWSPNLDRAFVLDPEQKPVFTAMLSGFRDLKNRMRLNSDEYMELLAVYVQSLGYDSEKFRLRQIKPDDHPCKKSRFPIEVIVDGMGLCGEKSYLLAALLHYEGYAVALLSFKNENHMTVGIPAHPKFAYRTTGYAVIESTQLSYIGDATGTYGEKKNTLSSNPRITVIGKGKTYSELESIQKIVRAQKILEEKTDKKSPDSIAIDRLRKKENNECKAIEEHRARLNAHGAKVDKLTGYEKNYSKQINDYNAAVAEFNERIAQYNSNNKALKEMIEKFNTKINLSNTIKTNAYDRKGVYNLLKREGYV